MHTRPDHVHTKTASLPLLLLIPIPFTRPQIHSTSGRRRSPNARLETRWGVARPSPAKHAHIHPPRDCSSPPLLSRAASMPPPRSLQARPPAAALAINPDAPDTTFRPVPCRRVRPQPPRHKTIAPDPLRPAPSGALGLSRPAATSCLPPRKKTGWAGVTSRTRQTCSSTSRRSHH
jgi:hypothetical protein